MRIAGNDYSVDPTVIDRFVEVQGRFRKVEHVDSVASTFGEHRQGAGHFAEDMEPAISAMNWALTGWLQ